jgi:integrase
MVVKCGSTSVTIYRNTPKKGYPSFLVRYFRGTTEVRVTRAGFEEAFKEAESAARSLANGEMDVLTLRSDDRLSYVRALANLKPTGVDLETATKEYAEARAILGGASLLEAARIHFQRQAPTCGTKTLVEVIAELVQQKIEKGRDEIYVRDLRLRPNRFAKSFKCSISSISTQQIEAFLQSLKVSGRTQNNFRRIVGTLFKFAIKRGYLPKDHPGVSGVELASEHPGEIEIFSPEEMSKLLLAAKPDIIPFLALGGFAGLRHAEIIRLDWEDVRLDEGHIEVKASKAKTKVRRLIPIHPNLNNWLRPYSASRGAVTPYANMAKQLMWLAEEAGVQWKHNALRHSYVSYRTAEIADVPRVSYESGNSPRIIERNYLKRVLPTLAHRWFSLNPPQQANIILLPHTVAAG